MQELSAVDRKTVKTLANVFYQVVPLNLRTYCHLTAEISKTVLQDFGISATVVPCQLLCATSDHNYAIGFVGNPPKDGKWDGHAICVAGDWFIDTAISHLQIQFGIDVPPVAFAPSFTVPTQVIGRINCSERQCLWWYHPPQGADTRMPEEPASLISEYSSQLIGKLSETIGNMPTVRATRESPYCFNDTREEKGNERQVYETAQKLCSPSRLYGH